MKIYLVGGAVRDKLLGLPVKERDWVVVGASVSEMQKLGYHQVGKEFPVFLHPKTNEEYALARMERKVKPGYKGFTVDTSPLVSLKDDLLRRDLTINAMAETETGELIDPYHGKEDLENKILRHVSQAFAEDPVRILRVGRFMARYAHLGFHVARETTDLMRKMVAAGEVNALIPERVWKELERALGEKSPTEFFAVLASCNALPLLFPLIDMQGSGILALAAAAQLTPQPLIRFAVLCHDFPDAKKTISGLCARYRIPNAYHELARLTALHYASLLNAKMLSADSLLNLFSTLDIYRREQRFTHTLTACLAIAKAGGKTFDPDWLLACAQAAKTVEVEPLLQEGLKGEALASKLKEKRAAAIQAWLKSRDAS